MRQVGRAPAGAPVHAHHRRLSLNRNGNAGDGMSGVSVQVMSEIGQETGGARGSQMETFLQSATHVVFLASIDDKTAIEERL